MEYLADYLAKFFSVFGQPYCYIPIIILGVVMLDRQLFANTICVLLFTTLLSILLKYTCKIPLNPALNIVGFAFPSGHMSSAMAFYGWLFANIRHSLLRIAIVVIISGIGFYLVYKGYHYPIDIIGSVTIVMTVIAFSYSLTKEQIVQKYPFMFGAILWILTVPMVIYLKILNVNCLAWVWTVFWGLLGFTISWKLFYKYFDLPQSKLNLAINLFMLITFIAIIKYIDYLFKQYLGYPFYLSWFLIGVSFPLSIKICHTKPLNSYS